MPPKQNRLRRAILAALYDHFKTLPLTPLDGRELAELVDAPQKEVTWNAAYLSLAGLLTLHSYPGPAGYGASLTAAGVELVESPRAMGRKLPLRKGKEE